MLSTMIMMTKAFIIGTREAVMAENILVSSCTRPKSRTILKARSSRTNQSGMSKGPKSTKDMTTTKRSSQIQPLRMNLRGQLAKTLIPSSTANIPVKAKFMLETKLSNSRLPFFLYCASRTQTTKFCFVGRIKFANRSLERFFLCTYRYNQDCNKILERS